MQEPILPQATETALAKMIAITKETIGAYECETNAMALNQSVEFFQSARIKQNYNTLYESASKEFMARKKEFTRFKSPMLKELVELQSRLQSEIHINMNFLEPMLNSVKVDTLNANHAE